jgi:hypothetical protein
VSLKTRLKLKYNLKFTKMAQDQQEKIFADGFIFKRNPKAPQFVVGRVSMKVEEAIAFLKTHEKNGWVNVDIKEARSGNHYIELDTFQPNSGSDVDKYDASKKKITPEEAFGEEEEEKDDLPF